MTSEIAEQGPPSPADESWCLIAEQGSVESRFGVRDCGPAPAGNRCALVAPAWAFDDGGHLRAGTLMVIADHVLGELSYRRRPNGKWSLTTELTLDLVAEIDSRRPLEAGATEVAATPDASFAQCRLTDGVGRIVAVGTTRTVVVPGSGGGAAGCAATPPAAQRLVAASIEQALGLSYPGDADVCLDAPGRWVNTFGIMHGGVAACVAEVAASRLFAQRNPQLRTAHMHTSYLRPVPPGRPYVATARVYHTGRGFAVAEVLGRSGDQLCTVSTITARGGPDVSPSNGCQPARATETR